MFTAPISHRPCRKRQTEARSALPKERGRTEDSAAATRNTHAPTARWPILRLTSRATFPMLAPCSDRSCS